MKRNRIRITHFLWLISLLLGLMFLFEARKGVARPEENVKDVDLSNLALELEQEAAGYFDELLPIAFNSEQATKAYELKKEKWYIIQRTDGIERFWNSNKIGLDSNVLRRGKGSEYFWFGDDFYLAFAHPEGAVLAYRLVNDRHLSKRIIKEHPELRQYTFAKDQNPGSGNVFRFINHNVRGNWAWIVLLLFFTSCLLVFFRQYKKKHPGRAIGVALLLLLVDVLLTVQSKEISLGTVALYQPELYANSNLLSSLGALINHLLVAIPWLFLLKWFMNRVNYAFAFRFAVAILAFFTMDLVLGLCESLVLDSNISFNFEQLYGLTAYTFLALSMMGLMFYGVFYLITQCKLFWRAEEKEQVFSWLTFLSLVIAASLFAAFQVLDAHRTIGSLSFPIAITLLISMHFLVRHQRLRAVILYTLAIGVCSFIILNAQIERETRYVHHYATKLITQQDLRAEYILRSFEDQLAEEFLVPEDYQNFKLRKDQVENRIKRLYFSNYLEKYELRLASFDSLGNNINDNTLFKYEDLNRIYNEQTKRTVSNYFYQINTPALVNGFIAKYENCDIHGHYGTTFILLQPRLIQSDFLYPDAFANQKKRELIKLDDYSYAIYFDKRLNSQKGQFNYNLNELPERPKGRLNQQVGGYYHFIFNEAAYYQVVLSKKFNVVGSWFSTFTFCFLLLLPMVLLLLLATYIYDAQDRLWLDVHGRFLSTRIQFSLTLILLIGLLLSVYIMINYIRSNYNSSLENRLLGTIKNISAQFQNTVDLQAKLKDDEQRQLIINEESSAFKVDLNLYDADGKLLSTTKPYLIDEQILSSLMNPKAFEQMQGKKSSQLLMQEELEGSEYLSAYVPLFNARNQAIGYLNIPYFAKNEELNRQISTVIVNVINIYFLLLLGGILIALFISKQISKPLLMIRQRFAETGLGVKNELIVYNRDDEIGQLVKQYNQMVLELEESARQLAAKEREGAWREMAKQVAHEIKNPLTPMKLSIQHLQRAYDQGGEKLDDLFKRTSALLIEQIDSLSRMASEFSNFAKMPEENYERFNLSEALRSTVNLFDQSERVKLVSHIADGIWTFADPEQIKRVFNNLIKNAIQAIPEHRSGEVSISLEEVAGKAIIRVTDNGKGISEGIQPRVFEPNFSTKNSGMGLGLAICRKIVETAKGTIDFVTEHEQGTTFTVQLPIDEK